LSSFLLISNFFGVLSEERRKSLGVLKTLGFTSNKMWRLMFVEGSFYLWGSVIVGVFGGICFGRYLLGRVYHLAMVLSPQTTDRMDYTITFSTIFIGTLITIVLPYFVLESIPGLAARRSLSDPPRPQGGENR
jgi:putative ABC transport system permease protein